MYKNPFFNVIFSTGGSDARSFLFLFQSMKELMKNVLFAFLLIAFASPAIAQINETDAKGRKQGKWIQYWPGNKFKRFEGRFKDDKPEGKFRYFFKDGALKAVMIFETGGVRSHALLYYASGNLMGEGDYVNKEKTGTWKFYSELGHLTSKDHYMAGKKEGQSTTFLPDGKIGEISNWKAGVQQGNWKTFYETGQVREECRYENNQRTGVYNKYFMSGKLLATGKYEMDIKEGGWKYFHENGSLDYQELWKDKKRIRSKKENGKVITEFEDGRPKTEYEYVGGKREGEFKEYHNNGSFKRKLIKGDPTIEKPDEWVRELEGQTLKCKGKYLKGNLHGKVTYYNESGMIIKTEHYNNGTLLKTE